MTDVLVPGVLEKFSETDAAIANLETEFGMLTITDLESKEQYDKVHDGRMMLVKMRTQGIDTIEKELKAPGIAFNKAVGEEAEKRRTQLKKIEAHLKSEEEKVDAIKEAARQEKIRKGQEKLNERIKKMSVVGGCVDISIIAPLSDEDFEIEFLKAEKIYDENKRAEEIENARLAEEKIARDEANAKLAKDQEEFEERKRIMEEKEREIEARQKVIDDAQKAKDEENRIAAQKILDDAEAAIKAEAAREAEEKKKPDRDRLLAYVEKIRAVTIPEWLSDPYDRFPLQITGTIDMMEKLIRAA